MCLCGDESFVRPASELSPSVAHPPDSSAPPPTPAATNVDAVVYLMLANELVHELLPDAITIAEDVSGAHSW